ncbi:MAG: PaaI family thioesterase [Syntrophomonadaceae bacterium]|nr:PaaI family thioesterase [Syntrophomonadaceae bacterium]
MDYAGASEALSAEAIEHLKNSPPCFHYLNGTMVGTQGDDTLVVSFPVKKEYCNPAGSMQGGFVTAAFDNVFGPLSHLVFKTLTTTVNINTNYHRPIFPGDTLTIKAWAQTRGRTLTHMLGEAYNSEGKLVASADCHYMTLPSRE